MRRMQATPATLALVAVCLAALALPAFGQSADDRAAAAEDAYLKATVVNLVHGRRRKRAVAERSPNAPLRVVPSAEDDVVGRLGRDAVLDAVATLPLRQRACVVMRHWMRMSETEIADSLDVSVGSVRTHVKRGTETLKKRLGDHR